MNRSSIKHFSHLLSLLLLAPFVVLGLSACAEGQSGQGADSTARGAGNTAMNSRRRMENGPASAQNTISLLRSGVKNVAVNQAVQNLNGWQQKLQKQQKQSGNQAFSKLNDDLGQLKNDLQAPQIDGPEVGRLLSDLGQQTSQAAEKAPGDQRRQIQQLGKLLTQAGHQLTGSGS